MCKFLEKELFFVFMNYGHMLLTLIM